MIAIENNLVNGKRGGGSVGGGGGGSKTATGEGGTPLPTNLDELGISIKDGIDANAQSFRTVEISHHEGTQTDSYRVHDAFTPEVDQRTCYDQVGLVHQLSFAYFHNAVTPLLLDFCVLRWQGHS